MLMIDSLLVTVLFLFSNWLSVYVGKNYGSYSSFCQEMMEKFRG